MKKKLSICSAAVLCSLSGLASANSGGIQDFLDSLRDFESGINPALADFYAQNLDNPVYTYARVTEPGRLVRDCATGSMISEPTTIREFFTKLGIDDIYNPATPNDPQMFKSMQYNSMNAWGFVGYQLGEALLIDSGYYSPQTVTIDGNEYDSFYVFVDDSNWIGCKTEALVEIEGSGGNKVYGTDNNRWLGTFVGKNGVNSFNDLLNPDKQELVIRDAMRFNYNVMTQLLENNNMTWAQALAKSWPDTDDDGNPITVQATMSGLLAAAHLRGAWGTAALLTNDQITCDELGTCITKYVYRFGGFNTIFDTPADDTIEGSQYDESMSAGWGNDTVITGGGVDTVLLHEQAGSSTTITDFTVGEDRIVLKDWVAAAPLANLTVSDVAGGAEMQFASQTVILNSVTAAQVNADVSAVIVKSDSYTIAWTGTQTVQGFDPAVDKVRGSAGIDFKHLKAYESENGLVVGVEAADGGIYSYIELVGLGLSDLHPDMFENISGSFSRLGYIVSLGWQNWGWGKELTVNNFDPAKTVMNMGVFSYTFSALKLCQVGSDSEITLAQGSDGKKLILKNVQGSQISAANFSGVSGNFADINTQCDNAITHDVSVTVGANGTVSPAPDAQGKLTAQEGSDLVVSFVPDAGYKVAAVTVDGTAVNPAPNSYTFSNVTSAHTLAVTFAPDDAVTHEISASVSGTGGSISPAPDAQGKFSVVEGDDLTLNFVADSGYVVDSVVVNGSTLPDSPASYTFSNVTSAQSLTVSFKLSDNNGCPAAWSATKTYWGGDQATYNGKIYEAKWWSLNNLPTGGDPWKFVQDCTN